MTSLALAAPNFFENKWSFAFVKFIGKVINTLFENMTKIRKKKLASDFISYIRSS